MKERRAARRQEREKAQELFAVNEFFFDDANLCAKAYMERIADVQKKEGYVTLSLDEDRKLIVICKAEIQEAVEAARAARNEIGLK